MSVTTRGDLKRHCRLEMGLDGTTGSDEDLLMNDWANAAVRNVLTDTHCVIRDSTVNLVVGVGDYALSGYLAILERFETDSGQVFRLARKSVDEILEYRRASSVANDVPRYYAQEGDLLMLYPAPASASTITLFGVAVPTEMSSDSHDFTQSPYGELPIYAADAVVQYMLWRAARHTPSWTHYPETLRAGYEQECLRVRKLARRMGGRRLNPTRIGYPDRIGFPHRNDVYPGWER